MLRHWAFYGSAARVLLVSLALAACAGAAPGESGGGGGSAGTFLYSGTPADEAAEQRHVCGMKRDWGQPAEEYAPEHPSRVLTGYMASSRWAIMEFLFMTYSSWATHTDGYPARFDIVVAGDPAVASTLSAVCTVVPEGVDPAALREEGRMQQCFFFPYPDRSAEQYGFFGINQAAFLLDDRIGGWLATYDLVLKSDFDVFLMPGMLDFFPPPGQVVFGKQLFVLMPETRAAILGAAEGMGRPMPATWEHNLGMTSYGTYAQLRSVAAAMVPAIKHILETTFPQKEGGGPDVASPGDGWPRWCLYVAAMYAQEVAANTVLPSFAVDARLDAHSDLEAPSESLLHVHCQHGAQRFSKHDFFRHQYQDLDTSGLNLLVAKDCVTHLAVGAWRAYLKSTGQPQPPPIVERDEL